MEMEVGELGQRWSLRGRRPAELDTKRGRPRTSRRRGGDRAGRPWDAEGRAGIGGDAILPAPLRERRGPSRLPIARRPERPPTSAPRPRRPAPPPIRPAPRIASALTVSAIALLTESDRRNRANRSVPSRTSHASGDNRIGTVQLPPGPRTCRAGPVARCRAFAHPAMGQRQRARTRGLTIPPPQCGRAGASSVPLTSPTGQGAARRGRTHGRRLGSFAGDRRPRRCRVSGSQRDRIPSPPAAWTAGERRPSSGGGGRGAGGASSGGDGTIAARRGARDGRGARNGRGARDGRAPLENGGTGWGKGRVPEHGATRRPR